MIKLSVDDFDQGREPRADTLDINQPKESPPRARRPAARGYYLALTFGTLLSSQGADAHEPRPSGLRSRRLFHVTPPAAMVKPRVCDPGRLASSSDARYNRLPSGCIPAAARLLSDRHPVQPTGRGVCSPCPAPVSPGAEKKLRAPGGGVKPVGGDAGPPPATALSSTRNKGPRPGAAAQSGRRGALPPDTGDRSLAPAENQPAARQPDVLGGHHVGIGDPFVVEVGTALLHRAASLGEAADQAGELHELSDGRNVAVHGDAAGLLQRCAERVRAQCREVVAAEQGSAGRLGLSQLLGAVHQQG